MLREKPAHLLNPAFPTWDAVLLAAADEVVLIDLPPAELIERLEQGKVYWNIRFTDVPPAENPNFRIEVTNQWLTEVLDQVA